MNKENNEHTRPEQTTAGEQNDMNTQEKQHSAQSETTDEINVEKEGVTNSDTPNEKADKDASKAQTPEEKIEQLEDKVKDLNNKLLYKVAEFDNYRKRTLKEKADLILNGGEKVLKALLPVVDDLERAEANIAKAQDVEALKQGLELVFQKFEKTLQAQGLKKIDAVGADFDTDYHEAVAFVPTDDKHKGKVIDCIQNGYTLNDKVIRFAKVAVGQAGSMADKEADSSDKTEE